MGIQQLPPVFNIEVVRSILKLLFIAVHSEHLKATANSLWN